MRREPGVRDFNGLTRLVRTLSSIKMTAAFLGLWLMRNTIDHAEAAVDRLHLFNAPLSPEVVTALERAVSFVRLSIQQHRAGAAPNALHSEARAVIALFASLPDATQSIIPNDLTDDELFVAEATQHLTLCREALSRVSNTPSGDLDDVHAAFRAIHTFKGNAAMMGLPKLEELARAVERAIDDVRSREAVPTPELIRISIELLNTAEQGLIESEVLDVGDPTARVAPVLAKARQLAKSTRIGELLVDQDLVSRSDLELALSIQRAPLGEALVRLQALDSEQLDWALRLQKNLRSGTEVAPSRRPATPRRLIPVDTTKLDRLTERLASLRSLVTRWEVDGRQNGSRGDGPLRAELNETVDELMRLASKLQCVAANQLFDRCRRIAQQTAKALNKHVEVKVGEGDTLEIHRRITEAAADSLLHIVRNAVDHGIEDVPDRLAAGKPEAGQIRVSCTEAEGEVVIEIEDDGRGINRERLLAKAKAQGLVEPNAPIAEEGLLGLIFEPGFSSAEKVTDVSGRGVGLDVVRTSVEEIGGRVTLSSTEGSGTRFRLSFPATYN